LIDFYSTSLSMSHSEAPPLQYWYCVGVNTPKH